MSRLTSKNPLRCGRAVVGWAAMWLAGPGPATAQNAARPQSFVMLQSAESAGSRRRDYPLNCRGGGELAFVPIGPPSRSEQAITFEVPFAPGASASGQDGQGLQPGTCAWIDRPVNAKEPRRVRVKIHLPDSMPRRTAGDSAIHWSFLAHDSDSGYFAAVAYRSWTASWVPPGNASEPPASTASRMGRPLPFDLRALAIVWLLLGLLLWAPSLILGARLSGWRRLTAIYQAKAIARGRRVRCGWMIIGFMNYRTGVRMTADDSYVHFSMGPLVRPGHAPFSVPWSDIEVTRDGWPWFPMQGRPVIRLRLARQRALRILVPLGTGEELIDSSGGRLQLGEPVGAGAVH